MSQGNEISGVSGRKARRTDLGAEFERAYQEELQSAKSGGASATDESGLRERAMAKVRSRYPEADPAELGQAAWAASQGLQALARG